MRSGSYLYWARSNQPGALHLLLRSKMEAISLSTLAKPFIAIGKALAPIVEQLHASECDKQLLLSPSGRAVRCRRISSSNSLAVPELAARDVRHWFRLCLWRTFRPNGAGGADKNDQASRASICDGDGLPIGKVACGRDQFKSVAAAANCSCVMPARLGSRVMSRSAKALSFLRSM